MERMKLWRKKEKEIETDFFKRKKKVDDIRGEKHTVKKMKIKKKIRVIFLYNFCKKNLWWSQFPNSQCAFLGF